MFDIAEYIAKFYAKLTEPQKHALLITYLLLQGDTPEIQLLKDGKKTFFGKDKKGKDVNVAIQYDIICKKIDFLYTPSVVAFCEKKIDGYSNFYKMEIKDVGFKIAPTNDACTEFNIQLMYKEEPYKDENGNYVIFSIDDLLT